MKKKILFFLVFSILTVLGFTIAIAVVPPPPVNQSLGLYDTFFASFKESDCRGCHGTNVADRHHLLVQTENKECLDCHDLKYNPNTGSWELQSFRDCTICHKASPHHTSPAAMARHCNVCHGSFVDNYDDGHYIPTYPKSMVTPDTSGRDVVDNQTGKIIKIGGCKACHVDNPLAVPPIAGNAETHHGTGIQNCSWCHQIKPDGSAALDIRVCETCHGVKSLHNIQADSDNLANKGTIVAGQENLGYGHIGNNLGLLGLPWLV